MSEYRLSASLREHEDDVRGVAYPDQSLILSASRDATVRIWRLLSSTPPKYDPFISSHVQSFVNAISFLPPNSDHPEGLIFSGGKDTIIDVRQPNKAPEADAERLLLGHAHNICALDVSPDGQYLVSGSWDGTARVWSLSNWETISVLEGHQGSVWAVLAFSPKIIITACADKVIRLFDSTGKKYGEASGSTDVVRALCRLTPEHSSGADFASAGNDGIVRLWKLNGSQVAQLHGHESFIYSIASLPSGEIVSSGEDRTVRIWKGTECVQTITHPAISVWAVAACPLNGDIVSGASDKIVRVFSRDKERQATPEDIKLFEESVKASAIPQQQVGNVNKGQLPGSDFLQTKSGTKEGQVQMIQETDGSVSAHQWVSATQSWLNVGTVVDSVGSSGRKTTFEGKDYDYLFDVDISEDRPHLQLPYNLSQNPYEAATKFLENNELPLTYLDQVADFITKNVQGATLGQGQGQAAAGPDAWGTESRYRPGDAAAPQSSTAQGPPARPKVLPQKTYLSIKTANLTTVFGKIKEFNQQFVKEGSSELLLDAKEIAALDALRKPLEKALSKPASNTAFANGLPPVLKIVSSWPSAFRLPVLDLVRLLVASSLEFASEPKVLEILLSSGFEDLDRPNNIMLAIRGLGNLFEIESGRDQLAAKFDQVYSRVKGFISSENKNLLIAIATLYVNYAVLFTKQAAKSSTADRSLSLADDLTQMIKKSTDSEATYRSLVAIGTLLDLSEDVLLASKEILGLPIALDRAEQKLKEPRIKSLNNEIRKVMSA